MKVLITGSSGYVARALLAALRRDVSVMGLDWTPPEQSAAPNERFVTLDLRDRQKTAEVFGSFSPEAVVHLAGYKYTWESLAKPLDYWDNNVSSTLSLAAACRETPSVKTIVFLSSSSVYGSTGEVGPETPYGWTKLTCEKLLESVVASGGYSLWNLRAFSICGGAGGTRDLFTSVADCAAGGRSFTIHADSLAAARKSPGRDFVHVEDVAEAIICALSRDIGGCQTADLCRGTAIPVWDVVREFQRQTGGPTRIEIAPPRPGDVATTRGDPSTLREVLDWRASRQLTKMVSDAWAKHG